MISCDARILGYESEHTIAVMHPGPMRVLGFFGVRTASAKRLLRMLSPADRAAMAAKPHVTVQRESNDVISDADPIARSERYRAIWRDAFRLTF